MDRPSVKSIRKYFKYSPTTGILRWRIDKLPARAGDVAGTLGKRGYLTVGFNRSRHYVHRLIFIYMTGSVPEYVDHKNRNKTDNRWKNLRKTTKSKNGANMVRPNKHGFKGIYYSKNMCRFVACIKINYKKISLGTYDTAEEAHMAYRKAAKKYYGQYARF